MTNERTESTENDPGESRSASDGGRRALLAGGAAAAAGAAFFATSGTARAASGDPFLLGRANTASGGTSLQATTSVSAFTVYQKGSGNGAFLVSDDTIGVTGRTLHPNAWAAVAQNASTATGVGGALRVEGRQNTGLFADVDNGELDCPAVAAFGGDPDAGTALFTRGMAILDGDVLALRNHVGVLNTQEELDYAPVDSGYLPAHTLHGTLTLEANGTRTVALPANFLHTIVRQSMIVTLTPLGGPMPNLHIVAAPTADSTGFQVAGGTGAGTVNYTVRAERLVLGVPALLQAGQKAQSEQKAQQKAQVEQTPKTASQGRTGPRRPRLRFTDR
ncbi:MAG: hypothetical protein QG608_3571 [Actinomycetota bacterium]|nr:hypothetical protein [Actinomycetota bacterium]